MGSPDAPSDKDRGLLDEVWASAAGVGCTIASFAAAPFGIACNAAEAAPPAPGAVATPPLLRTTKPVATASITPPARPSSPPPSGSGVVAPAVPGGLVAVAAAHPYSTAFLMGVALTGSCLAGAGAASYAFKRGAGRAHLAQAQITHGGGGRYSIRPAVDADARLARMEAALREIQQGQVAEGVGEGRGATYEEIGERISPLQTQVAELDAKVAGASNLQKKIQATLDSVRETQRNELLTLRQEIHDQLAEANKIVEAGYDRARQSHKAMTAALRESVQADIKAVLESLEGLPKQAAPAAAEVELVDPVDLAAPIEAAAADPVTPMDVNVSETLDQLASKAASAAASTMPSSTEPDLDLSSAILSMIAEVKSAEPQLAERLSAASAEWSMIAAIKAAEPYLDPFSPSFALAEGAGSSTAKLLRAVKAAEPFASRRYDAATAIWKIVLAIKEAEPRIAPSGGEIGEAEWEMLRAIKAAEPHLVEDLEIAGTASKMLRAVKAAEPTLRARFGENGAEKMLLKKAKWSEPVLKRGAWREAVSGETGDPGRWRDAVSGDSTGATKWDEAVSDETAAESDSVAAEPAALGKQGKHLPRRRVMAACSPIQDESTSTSGLASPSEPAPQSQTSQTTPQDQAQTPPRRNASNQPVRYLGVTDSGEWKFTLMTPLAESAGRDDGPIRNNLQIQSREIMLCRQSQRSWAGELLSLWQSHVHEHTSWSVGPFTTAVVLNPDIDMVVLDGAWWRCSRDGDVYTVREKVAEDAD